MKSYRPCARRSSRHTGTMAPKRPKRPRDPNQLGKLIVELSVGEAIDVIAAPADPATEYARKGGIKGGHARAVALTHERRIEIAREAAAKRWENRKKK